MNDRKLSKSGITFIVSVIGITIGLQMGCGSPEPPIFPALAELDCQATKGVSFSPEELYAEMIEALLAEDFCRFRHCFVETDNPDMIALAYRRLLLGIELEQAILDIKGKAGLNRFFMPIKDGDATITLRRILPPEPNWQEDPETGFIGDMQYFDVGKLYLSWTDIGFPMRLVPTRKQWLFDPHEFLAIYTDDPKAVRDYLLKEAGDLDKYHALIEEFRVKRQEPEVLVREFIEPIDPLPIEVHFPDE